MNILITSAGRRTYMAEYFREALRGEGLVFASNSVLSPALSQADDYVITPLIYSDEYIPFLLRYCEEKGVGLLLSLFDPDLPVLAAHREDFRAIGVRLAVPDEGFIADFNDKQRMFLKLWRADIRCPETVTDVDEALMKVDSMAMSFPLVVKPRFGSGSIGILRAGNKKELACVYAICERTVDGTYLRYESEAAKKEKVVIQQTMEGTEYGLDIVSDLDGNYQDTFVRKKISMRAGETDEAVILGKGDQEYDILRKLGMQFALSFPAIGLVDVDVIMGNDMRPYVIDVNPRFGGGYPFSHAAGADVPRAYVLWAEGRGEEAKACLRTTPGVRAYKDIEIRKVRTQHDRRESI